MDDQIGAGWPLVADPAGLSGGGRSLTAGAPCTAIRRPGYAPVPEAGLQPPRRPGVSAPARSHAGLSSPAYGRDLAARARLPADPAAAARAGRRRCAAD